MTSSGTHTRGFVSIIIIGVLLVLAASYWPAGFCNPEGLNDPQLCNALPLIAEVINAILSIALLATAYSALRTATAKQSGRLTVLGCAFIFLGLATGTNALTFGLPFPAGRNAIALFTATGLLLGSVLLTTFIIMPENKARRPLLWATITALVWAMILIAVVFFEPQLPMFDTGLTKTPIANVSAGIAAMLLGAAALHYHAFYRNQKNPATYYFTLGILFLAFSALTWSQANHLFDAHRLVFRLFRLLAGIAFLIAIAAGRAALLTETTHLKAKKAIRVARESVALPFSIVVLGIATIVLAANYPGGFCTPAPQSFITILLCDHTNTAAAIFNTITIIAAALMTVTATRAAIA
ncbi:MAG: MASE3 domain-containing protein [Nanoarchaeota archaeon]